MFLSYSGQTAAVLFDIILGLFMQCESVNGKIVGTSYRMDSLGVILTCVVVLDEAHKYLINSDTARLTQSISSIMRQQRHLATRIIIATQVSHHRPIVTRPAYSPHVQEPTVVPSTMLDLASFVICHRFTSPSWCRHLAQHVSVGDNSETAQWFRCHASCDGTMRSVLPFGPGDDEQRQLGAATRQRLPETASPAALNSGWRLVVARRRVNSLSIRMSPRSKFRPFSAQKCK